MSAKWAKGTGGPAGDEAYNLVAHSVSPPLTRNPYGDNGSRDGLLVAHSLRAEGFDASEDGTGRGTPLVPVAQNSRDEVRMLSVDGQIAGAIAAEPGVKQQTYVAHKMAVRRLTPRECERLQGVPDDWTRIPWRGKPAGECPDGPRYKAIGNSWAIPVVNWIGRRLLEAMP